jgi:hypothetical protein
MPYALATNALERVATEYLTRRARPVGGTRPGRLSPAGCALLRRQERWTIAYACLAGAVAGGLLAAAEVQLHARLGGGLLDADWRDHLPQLSRFLAVTLLISVAEIAFLYWNALRMAAGYASHTGFGLLPDRFEDLRARGLARAALELPDPRDPVYGIDPFANVPWWRHWASTLLYRLKVGTTNFVLRALVRRVLGRAAFRFFVPLLAIPVFVVWNGLITWWALRQARIRAFGALAVREVIERLDAGVSDLGEDARRTLVDGVGAVLVRRRGAHPNLVVLLGALIDRLAQAEGRVDPDWNACVRRCRRLDPHERQVIVDVLALALVLDGRPRRDDRELLKGAATACGLSVPPDRLDSLREAVRLGQGLGDPVPPAAG